MPEPATAALAPLTSQPAGRCGCGCGRSPRLAQKTDRSKGWVTGQPVRFINGHNRRGRCRPPADRFWEKVDRSGGIDACWLWIGAKDGHGYGQIRVNGCGVRAHRLAYELTRGPVPPGLCVCHNCPGGDNLACVNPAHLFLDTIAGNNKDMVAKGRHRTSGVNGEQHGMAKLTEAKVREIHWRGADIDRFQRAIAKRFGVSEQTISDILTGRSWAHVKVEHVA